MHQNVGELAIDQSTSIPTVAALTRSGWVTLSDQPGSQASAVPDPAQLTLLPAGTSATADDLDDVVNGAVATTRAGSVFQKQHDQWWRLTATWTGECSAVPTADIVADHPALRWAASASVRA